MEIKEDCPYYPPHLMEKAKTITRSIIIRYGISFNTSEVTTKRTWEHLILGERGMEYLGEGIKIWHTLNDTPHNSITITIQKETRLHEDMTKRKIKTYSGLLKLLTSDNPSDRN